MASVAEGAEVLTRDLSSSSPSLRTVNSDISDSDLSQPTHDIEDLVQAELSKHSKLDEQSRLIISLTVSITAQYFSQPHLNKLSTIQSNPVLEESVANIELKHSSLESDLKVLSNKFHSKCAAYDETISELNNQISELKQTATSLTKTNASLQYTIDEVEQYERRDSLVFSGKCIPKEQENENTTDIILQVLRQTLFMNELRRSDINVCHRLGARRKERRGYFIDRPIICKFISRSVKRDVKQSCLDLKPDLYANESLTNIRRDIYTKLRFVRKNYKIERNSELFPQLYTNDGKIMVKLQNKQKYMITNPLNLDVFLQEYPDIKAMYESVHLSRP